MLPFLYIYKWNAETSICSLQTEKGMANFRLFSIDNIYIYIYIYMCAYICCFFKPKTEKGSPGDFP